MKKYSISDILIIVVALTILGLAIAGCAWLIVHYPLIGYILSTVLAGIVTVIVVALVSMVKVLFLG